ncbi:MULTISPECIES: transporter substrate-binding domain-containing protein [unclassified Microbacterium]|uniref:transporter substrate-binding domain-containing protein n=1 Tax=unclassified Microbacterium TaxID=2609290 RepID=UPI000367840B|nr:transporter substrate-binding domain-containing protein [Microbacterium sp. 77mftsu3.1]SDH19572.1 extracellular solute-binding protein, family 3 [Microbacterium sp. 77mftsu3.1]
MPRRARAAAAASLIVGFVLAGCGVRPADADSTLERISEGGVLRAGVTANPPWTELGNEPSGTEVALVEAYAAGHGAEVRWREGAEEVLVDALHAGELDIVVGGLTDTTPWADEAAVTDVYREETSASGETEKHVMLARAGENGFLMDLEVFLREEGRE